MEAAERNTLPDGELLAALDLGSNSFHLLIARIEHGEMRPVEVLAEKVQLGAGLQNGALSQDAMDRGLDCLSRFAQRLSGMEIRRIRVVGTHALRIASNQRVFTRAAHQVLGCRADVIYGREEARLVYLGVAHTLSDDAQSRLVIDIGGGSTEFIIGERFEPRQRESLTMGCVSYGNEFFSDGHASVENFRRAYRQAMVEVSHIRRTFRAEHWVECVGSSGTLQSIEAVVNYQGWSSGGIDRASLAKLEARLLEFEHIEDIRLEGLSDQRRNVILPGVAITCALFDALGIETMRTSKGALREGVLYDLLGRLSHEDVRERSISALMQRHSVDQDLADIVERRARVFFTATRKSWQLSGQDWELLRWSARSHEIGMAISHKHFHRHSAYLLRNTDLPGFSQGDQELMALLAAGQRGKLSAALLEDLPDQEKRQRVGLLSILRLAAVFKYVETLEQLPEFLVQASSGNIHLEFPSDWLAAHPLSEYELESEQQQLAKIGMTLSFR